MEKEKTKLIEEDNTIYEIDLECLKRKERIKKEGQKKKDKKTIQEKQ